LKTLIIIGGTGFFGKSFLDYSFEFGLKKWGINKLILISRRKKKYSYNEVYLTKN